MGGGYTGNPRKIYIPSGLCENVKYLEIPDELYQQAEDVMKSHGYSTFTEFVKESIRFRIRELEDDE